MVDNIKTLANMIDDAKRIVFFGGAGVSTESGIPLEVKTAYTKANGKTRLKPYSAGATLTEIPQNSLNFTEKRYCTLRLHLTKHILHLPSLKKWENLPL